MHEIVEVCVNFGDEILLGGGGEGGGGGGNVKPEKILIFLKHGKNSKNCQNGSWNFGNFSRYPMTKRTSLFDSSREI